LKGNGIERSKLFFRKILKLTHPLENSEWEQFSFYNKVRNVIVHNGGKFNRLKDKDVVLQFPKYDGIKLSNNNELLLDEIFINTFIQNVELLLINLLDELRKHK
jgi:hypothetical protein